MLGFDSDEDEDHTPVAASTVPVAVSPPTNSRPMARSDSKAKKPVENTHTIAAALGRIFTNTQHVAIIQSAVERAHAATRLASRLLNFHALRCLERGLPLPVFGNVNWTYKASTRLGAW